jgi:tRNA (guanine37-N1)-methyltransferase
VGNRDDIWTAKVLTLFPEMFPGPLGVSLAGKGLDDEVWSLQTVAIRDFGEGKHRTVDDAPMGGGPGMVMRPDVVDKAVQSVTGTAPGLPLIYLTPRGRRLDQDRIRQLAAGPGVSVICGRFEGLDQRVLDAHGVDEVSLGDFVLSGGEPAAMAMIDACVRLLPGIVGSADSLAEESFERGLLEYPQYTRPQEWNGQTVPGVLTSGHHENIRAWRLAQAEAVTRERRPDLWARYGEKAG